MSRISRLTSRRITFLPKTSETSVALRMMSRYSQGIALLIAAPGSWPSRGRGALGDADAVILGQSHNQDQPLDGEDLGQMKMLVLVEQHGAHAALGAGDAFHHGEHHPAHGRVLAEHFNRPVGGPQNDNLPHHLPLAEA